MNRIALIFLLLITFNANSIAGPVMLSSMDNMEMSHDCHGDMNATMDMMNHCGPNGTSAEGCDGLFCGDCVYHSTSAVIPATPSIAALDSLSPEFQYLLTESLPVYTRMLRPPQA